MSKTRFKLLAPALLLAAFPALAVDGQVPIPMAPVYATPIFISAPGSYVVTRNLPATGAGAIISIAVPPFLGGDVEIDLNGFVLDNTPNPAAPVIDILAAGSGEVTIRNGTLIGGSAGIQKGGGPGSKVVIEDVRISGFNCFSAGGAAAGGIYLFDPEEVVIRRSVIKDFAGAGGPCAGISLNGGVTHHGMIEDNQIQNVNAGIVVFTGASIEISNNQIRNISDGGFTSGILIDNCRACLVAQNTITDVGVAGPAGTGIFVRQGEGNKLHNNLVQRARVNGIWLASGANDNFLLDNVVSASGGDGILVDTLRNHLTANTSNFNGFGGFGTGFGIHLSGLATDNHLGRNVAVGNAGPAAFCVNPWSPDFCDDAGPPFPAISPPNWSFGDNLMPGAAGPL